MIQHLVPASTHLIAWSVNRADKGNDGRMRDVRNPSMLSKKGSTDGSSTDSWCSGVGGRFADDGRGGVVAVCHDHYTGVGAKVQVAELMTGRKRGDEQLRRIPSRCIAAEHWVGRTSYGRFAPRADLVRTRIGAVRRRAGALIAGPVDTSNRCDACLSRIAPPALGYRRRLRYFKRWPNPGTAPPRISLKPVIGSGPLGPD